MVLLSLLLQADLVGRLGTDDIEIREAARQELLMMGGKALPALRESNSPEARDVAERILDAADRSFRDQRQGFGGSCGNLTFLGVEESARRVGELAKYFPGCRIRAAHVQCMHRNLCHRGGLYVYGVAEDDAEVFVIKDGWKLGDALLRRLAPVPGREEEVARTLAGGWTTDKLVFDAQGRLIRIDRK